MFLGLPANTSKIIPCIPSFQKGKKSFEKYICCNADEGDSGTFADRMLIEGDPYTLIEGMTIAAIAVGATEGIVYLRSEYPYAIKTLQKTQDKKFRLMNQEMTKVA